MFWYRSRQNVKPSCLSGSPWLIGVWRLRPFVRMVGRCAAPPTTASPSASAKASANRIHRADARIRMRGSYNDFVYKSRTARTGRRCPRPSCSLTSCQADDRQVTERIWIEAAQSRFRGEVILGHDLLEIRGGAAEDGLYRQAVVPRTQLRNSSHGMHHPTRGSTTSHLPPRRSANANLFQEHSPAAVPAFYAMISCTTRPPSGPVSRTSSP